MNGQYASPYVGLVKVILTVVTLIAIFGAMALYLIQEKAGILLPNVNTGPALQPSAARQPEAAAPEKQPSAGSVAQMLEQMAARSQPAPQQDPEQTRAERASQLRQKEAWTTAGIIALLAGVVILGLAALILAVYAGKSQVIRAEAKARREQELEEARRMWKNTPGRR